MFLYSYLSYRVLRIYTAPRCGLRTPCHVAPKFQSGCLSTAFYPLKLTRELKFAFKIQRRQLSFEIDTEKYSFLMENQKVETF